MLDTIRAKSDEIHAIAQRNKVDRLWVFGSVARKEETPESDIDFIVEFRKDATLLDHGRLYNALTAAFGRGVDVIDRGAINENSIFLKTVVRDMVAV